MRTRQIVSFALLVTMLLTLCLPNAMAAGSATVTLSSGEVKAGETVTLTAQISQNPGVAAFMLYIYYDTSVFELDPASDLSAAGAFGSSGMTIGNSIALAKENGRYNGDAGKDGALLLWFNGSGMNTAGDGDMMTVTLRAKAGAANGSYAVELGYSPDDTCSEDGTDVHLQTSGATVTVTGGSSSGTGSGTTKPDSGATTPDGGTTKPDSGTPAPDNGTTKPDSGATKPDAGTTTPDTELPPSFTEDPTQTAPEKPVEIPKFRDVKNHWAQEYITEAARLGLIQGYQGLYRPNDTMTRAECVTILWRAAGCPAPSRKASFTDLKQDWYLDAVAWAEENGVVNGVGKGKFDPNGTVTREQLATILFRQAGAVRGMEMLLGSIYDASYSDSGKVSDWAKPGLYWSIFNVIYCGEHSTDVGSVLAPREAADRAQIAVMIVRYLEMEGEK